METINDLTDLLLYEVGKLYAAEEMIDRTIPSIIEKANHNSLKNALKHHATLTAEQKQRLNKAAQLIKEKRVGNPLSEKNTIGTTQNKAMDGLIEEINELLGSKLSNDVNDAAIIASVQKIEHYEICAYGTAHAFAQQLHWHAVAELLNETLQEEYDADDLLTSLATAALNKEAVPAGLAEDTNEVNDVAAATDEDSDADNTTSTVSISERTINSPGGRAGTSHRRYGTGESRGH